MYIGCYLAYIRAKVRAAGLGPSSSLFKVFWEGGFDGLLCRLVGNSTGRYIRKGKGNCIDIDIISLIRELMLGLWIL